MQELKGFQYATALDLNMGFYTLYLYPLSQEYVPQLPIGVNLSINIHQ